MYTVEVAKLPQNVEFTFLGYSRVCCIYIIIQLHVALMQGVWGYAPPENMCTLRLFVVTPRVPKRMEITKLKNSLERGEGERERERNPTPCTVSPSLSHVGQIPLVLYHVLP